MAKIIVKGKRKRFIAITALALSATLSLGVLAACGGTEQTEPEEPEVSTPTDTQVIKNGNFEFFSEMTEEELSARRNLINDPTNWNITTVSPSSDTKSGIIDVASEGWNNLAKPGRELTGLDDAYAHWDDEGVTAYDRLKFLDEFSKDIDALDSGSEQRTFFDDYRSGGTEQYSIDYEDVSALAADFPNGISLHEGVKENDTHVLMLHTTERSDGVLGTATYATSSTTITLKGGTAAKVSVWVCTDKLYHYYDDADKEQLEKDGGAYISVVNTVGSNSSSGEFVIKNINTKGEWQQFTVYIRANTYATTTYRIKLGLGRNTSSDNRLEGVNGYAFFDDVVGETITENAYNAAIKDLPGDVQKGLNTLSKDRILDATKLAEQEEADTADTFNYTRTFAFDLLGETLNALTVDATTVSVDLTEETSGSRTMTSADKKVGDNRNDETVDPDKRSIAEATTYTGLETKAGENGYLKNIFDNDFKGNFPFYMEDGETVKAETPVIMLLSTNGAAYTAKLENDSVLSLEKDNYMLISFFVKTSKIRTGKTGATISLIDGSNETTITAFDSTTVATVDIDKDNKDIYKGWVQCFFIVKNETDDTKTFSLEFSYGPTSIVGSKTSDYADGYAAFANFEYAKLNKTQANYASTGTYAKSVSLTASAKDTTKFDDAANSYDIEKELSAPAAFRGTSANAETTGDIVSGLLNAEYKSKYWTNADGDKKFDKLKTLATAQSATADDWWEKLFGDKIVTERVATQPLIIYNAGAEAAPSYGYTMRAASATIEANASQVISMRVKVEATTTAYIYLTDVSDPRKDGFDKRLSPAIPSVTYWYDDNGNIVRKDPSDDEFNAKEDILFYREDNGLYTKAKATGDPVYYANLHNYTVDEDGNYLTKDGTIAYYCDPADGKIYAYRTETGYDGDKTLYAYSTEVHNLPTADDEGNSITRYAVDRDVSGKTTVIAVDGSKLNGAWANVAFYVRTGSESKQYRLEIWAGNKTNGTDGLPAGGYVFVDTYKNESSSNFEGIRDERVSTLKEDSANLTDPTDETSNLIPELALYNTFSFFDSDTFIRYDKSQDTENEGDPWIDYKQSDYEEGLAWLKYENFDEESEFASEIFLDYSVSEVEVAEHVYETDDETDTEEEDTDSDGNGTNIWLIISSAVLAVVLIFAIVAVIVRRLYKRRNKSKIKVVKSKSAKKAKQKAKAEAKPDEKNAPDENDPYNE